jgi:ABC-type multidrug transport system ATPase subunit
MKRQSNFIIETANLSFGFNKNEPTVQDINIKVEKGAIYGFLGPNGAGKTTTIRLLLGLLPGSAGVIRLFGTPLSGNRIDILSKTGSLIEQPSLYEHLSGRENLEITRIIRKATTKRVAEVLELVKLSNAAGKKVAAYSLGMKQRLGLALALLSDPELLILDEPVNGLDPAGMIETRELLLDINTAYGVTIFLSSHLLTEIEKLVTHIGVINKGRLIFQGTIDQLKEINKNQNVIRLQTDNNPKVTFLLRDKYNVTQRPQNTLEIPFESREQVASICKSLVTENIDLYQVAISSKDLEQTFIEIIEKYN